MLFIHLRLSGCVLFWTRRESAQAKLLDYQGWAEGGNYLVMERAPCTPVASDQIDCAITVQDDPVLALETGFNVTDTFHLSFDGENIVDVKPVPTISLSTMKPGNGFKKICRKLWPDPVAAKMGCG